LTSASNQQDFNSKFDPKEQKFWLQVPTSSNPL
jgi:hypothetical protein